MVGNIRNDSKSVVEAKILAAMERNLIEGEDLYYAPALNGEVTAILNNNYQWQMGCSAWNNCEGETVFLSWVEHGILHMINWDVLYD